MNKRENKTMNHTPTPWEYDREEQIVKRGTEIIADLMSPTADGMKANGKFIVTACNAHKDLVKACKEAIGFIEHSSGDKYPENLIELLQQALAKAEGKS